ncbi:MAG: type IVB secretion system protein IcmW [Gammaproteobacteria bacterium]
MPDLTHEGVHQFWKEYHDPMIYRVVAFMESVEKWPLEDSPAFEEAMEKLGQELDNIGNYELGNEDDFIQLATSLKMGRSLRLLQCMDISHPGAASKLLIHAEEETKTTEDMHGLFLRRNIVFERLRLLARIFSQERFTLVMKALEGEE